MKCTLCGFEFDETSIENACKGCIFSRGCELIKCPNCGYEIVPEKKVKKKRRDR